MTPDPRRSFDAGLRFAAAGRWRKAAAEFAAAARLAPAEPAVHQALGAALMRLGRREEAATALRRAVALRPGDAQLLFDLGLALAHAGRNAEAAEPLEQAFALDPALPALRYSLGLALAQSGEIDRGLAVLEGGDAPTQLMRGLLLQQQGRVEEALFHLRQADTLCPDDLVTETNLALTLHYLPGVTATDLAEAHRRYGRRLGGREPAAPEAYANDPDPDRLPVVGLVSGDLRRHAVGILTLRAIEGLARRGVRLVVFAHQGESDAITARFRAAAAGWHDISRLDDTAAAALVRRHRIDILIDLAGHTARHRLPLFLRRPAPLQVTWAGYVGTTGLTVFDGLIADPIEVPPGEEAQYSEPVLRLPLCYVSYDPPGAAPAVGPSPALATGALTFGSFNRPAKLNAAVLALWAEILKAVPRARLFLNYSLFRSAGARALALERLAAAAIGPDRVAFGEGGTSDEMLAAYGAVDIALDPFPYSGGVTTLEALWMGVPVVSLRGQTFAGRHGATHLHAVGLDELVADAPQGYVATAVALADAPDRLAALRAGLRDRVARSPLCDGALVGGHLLDALLGLWRGWCERNPG
ncbi:MAG TPA: tetratricopeptide repeat protein [Stellaceae bacterium]|nr:tetratricopeptide repeat protein [Stellaceae bacterium]